MAMLTWVEIDTGRIRSNLSAFRSLAPAGTLLLAVAKSNAYGHGAEVVAPVLKECADWIGVNSLQEALEFKRLKIRQPILILGHTPIDAVSSIVRAGFHQVVYRMDLAEALAVAAKLTGKPARIHLKIETGTNRQGIPLRELSGFLANIRRLSGLELAGIYTHFANIEDTLDPSFALAQLTRFRRALAVCERLGVRPRVVHASASAGAMLYPETAFNMLRVGIGAYGIWPSRETRLAARERRRSVDLAPALSWRTRIVQLKNLNRGEFAGYGLAFQAARKTRLAVLPVGYADGFDRGNSRNGRVLVRGRAVPVAGRVMMNMTLVDVTGLNPGLDEEVVLIGKQGKSEISAEDVAGGTDTIPYEVVCRIHPAIPRIAV